MMDGEASVQEDWQSLGLCLVSKGTIESRTTVVTNFFFLVFLFTVDINTKLFPAAQFPFFSPRARSMLMILNLYPHITATFDFSKFHYGWKDRDVPILLVFPHLASYHYAVEISDFFFRRKVKICTKNVNPKKYVFKKK